jgi:hypothetical protein
MPIIMRKTPSSHEHLQGWPDSCEANDTLAVKRNPAMFAGLAWPILTAFKMESLFLEGRAYFWKGRLIFEVTGGLIGDDIIIIYVKYLSTGILVMHKKWTKMFQL